MVIRSLILLSMSLMINWKYFLLIILLSGYVKCRSRKILTDTQEIKIPTIMQ